MPPTWTGRKLAVAEFLEEQGIEVIGARSRAGDHRGALSAAADAAAEPLSPDAAAIIESYLAMHRTSSVGW